MRLITGTTLQNYVDHSQLLADSMDVIFLFSDPSRAFQACHCWWLSYCIPHCDIYTLIR
jgi:hypothetical protein